MTLEEIILKRVKIQEELESLRKEEQDLFLGKYKENIGKYFKHKYEYFSIRIDDIFFDHGKLFIVGPTYYSDKDNTEYKVNMSNQYMWVIECIKDWNDLHLEEVSEQEFMQTFYETIGIAISDFNSIIFNKQ